MEAIKCPNCGSEKVRQLTGEKYVCESCDNEFLIHNLSKEFRKTDEHITEIHTDLKDKLENIENALAKEGVGVGAGTGTGSILLEAETNMRLGKYIEAYELYEKYCVTNPDTYVGYFGKYCALTRNMYFPLAAALETDRNHLYDGCDCLKKALECSDCDKDKIRSYVEAYFKKNGFDLVNELEKEKSKLADEEQELEAQRQSIEDDIVRLDEKLKKIQDKMKKDEDWNREMAKDTRESQERAIVEYAQNRQGYLLKKWIPTVVVLVLSLIFIFPHSGFGWLILKILAVLVLLVMVIGTRDEISKAKKGIVDPEDVQEQSEEDYPEYGETKDKIASQKEVLEQIDKQKQTLREMMLQKENSNIDILDELFSLDWDEGISSQQWYLNQKNVAGKSYGVTILERSYSSIKDDEDLVSEITGYDWLESYEIINDILYGRRNIKENINYEEAEMLKSKLEAGGMKVEIKEM